MFSLISNQVSSLRSNTASLASENILENANAQQEAPSSTGTENMSEQNLGEQSPKIAGELSNTPRSWNDFFIEKFREIEGKIRGA